MYTRIELQPSDKNLMLRTQQKANDTLAPHFRLLQFFDSHFNAIKLVSAQTQRMFYRLTVSTAESLLRTSAHPLARELHFRIILFGLKLLKHSTIQDKSALWKLKDRLISAALAWFRHAPRYVSWMSLRIHRRSLTRALSGGHMEVIVSRQKPRIRSSEKWGPLCRPSRVSCLKMQALASWCRPNKTCSICFWKTRGSASACGSRPWSTRTTRQPQLETRTPQR